MDVIKYRKLYLCENWRNNDFVMVKHTIDNIDKYSKNSFPFINNHPRVLSGNAFWINDGELCIGYTMRGCDEIFRPIFSHKRQRILNKVNKNIINPIKFWNNIKSQYFMSLSKIRILPIDCINYIVEEFIY